MWCDGIGEVSLPRWLSLLAVLVLLLVPACAGTSDDSPDVDSSRIVTLSGDLTEIVYALGAGQRVVGVDVTTVAPEAALEIPVVGVGRFITAEGVLGADPTLVLADTQTAPLEAIDQIESAGVAVDVMEVATTFEELYNKIAMLGDLLGASDEADSLIEEISAEIEVAMKGVTNTGLRVAYIYTRGPDVMLLFGEGMTTRPLIEAAGAIDAGADIGVVETTQVSAETLVAAAPDVIIVPEEGLRVLGGVEAFLELPGVSETPAGRNGAILAYPEGDFLTFGPRIADSLSQLIADLRDLSK